MLPERVVKMAFWKKQTYMEWDEYHTFVQTVDDLLWRQAVREQSLANL